VRRVLGVYMLHCIWMYRSAGAMAGQATSSVCTHVPGNRWVQAVQPHMGLPVRNCRHADSTAQHPGMCSMGRVGLWLVHMKCVDSAASWPRYRTGWYMYSLCLQELASYSRRSVHL
jgi:hypothetical protein